jgi:hypothetical protein
MSRQIEQRRKQRKLKRLFPSDKLTLEDRHVPLTIGQHHRLLRWANRGRRV